MDPDQRGGVVKPVMGRIDFSEDHDSLLDAKTHAEYVKAMATEVLPSNLSSTTKTYNCAQFYYGDDPLGPVPMVDTNAPEPYWVKNAWNGVSEKKITSVFKGHANDLMVLHKSKVLGAVTALNLDSCIAESDVERGWEHYLGEKKLTATLPDFRIIVALIALVQSNVHRWRRPTDGSNMFRLDTSAWPYHKQWKIAPIPGTLQVHETILKIGNNANSAMGAADAKNVEWFDQAAWYRVHPCECCAAATTIEEYETCAACKRWRDANAKQPPDAFVWSKLNSKMSGNPFELTEHRYIPKWNTGYEHGKGEPVPDLSTAPPEQQEAPATSTIEESYEETEHEAAFYADHLTVIETVDSDEEAAEDDLDTRAEWLGSQLTDKAFFMAYPKQQLKNEGPAWLIRSCKDIESGTTGEMEKLTTTTTFGDSNGLLSRAQEVKASLERPAFGVRGVSWKVSL
jgi:hypothetical protein